jgi:hypothetical protein
VLCVSLARNVGFAGGVNLGVTHTTAPYVGVFNPDGVARPETVARLAAALEQDPNAFMAGARVVSAVPSEAPPAEDAFEANWLPGTAALYRRELFVAIGGFDPGFFMYCEDVDLSRRVRAQGWTLLLVPDALFAHGRAFSRVESMRRIRMWTVSNTCLVYQYGVPRRYAMARLARQRARWFGDLARQRRGWMLAGALWGSASWLASIPRLEHRRRHPWDRVALAEWLAASTSVVQSDELK